jgi:hypothetical protein
LIFELRLSILVFKVSKLVCASVAIALYSSIAGTAASITASAPSKVPRARALVIEAALLD